MMRITEDEGDYLTIHAGGKLTEDDYNEVLPQLERKFDLHDQVNGMLIVDDLEGIDPLALKKELKFDLEHRNEFGRVAIVGGGAMAGAASKFGEVFTSGQIRHFERDQVDQARAWLRE